VRDYSIKITIMITSFH